MEATAASLPVTAREYLRVSKDSSGRERSPEEQHDDNARDAKAQGWILGAPYHDLGSASRYARKDRDEFVQLVADLEAGAFHADVLMMWENSRGSRRVGEWVELIELLVTRRVQVHVTSHARTYDPTLRRDWRALMDDAVRAEDEVRQTSERVRRAAVANAVAGKPHGRTPYGYKRKYQIDGRTKIITQLKNATEAKVVTELFRRLASGHSLSSIAADFDKRGIRTRSGLVWSAPHLRKLAMTPAYTGWRVHHGELFEATWPKLIRRRQYLAVQRILGDPDRLTRRDTKATHLLSGIALCDVCGGHLRVTLAKTDPAGMYLCKVGGHVLVSKAELDDLVTDALLAWLSDETNYSAFTEPPDEGELASIADQLAEARSEHDALAGLSVRLAARMEPPLLERIAGLERRQQELRTPARLTTLLGPGDDMAARWEATPLMAQRVVARLVLVPELLGEARVKRSPRRGLAVPVEDRLEFVTKKRGEASPG